MLASGALIFSLHPLFLVKTQQQHPRKQQTTTMKTVTLLISLLPFLALGEYSIEKSSGNGVVVDDKETLVNRRKQVRTLSEFSNDASPLL